MSLGPVQGIKPTDVDPSSLLYTMALNSLQGPSQAELEQQRQQTQQQVDQARQQSEQAQQAYLGAAAAPVQQPAPGVGFFPELLGNVASVLTQNPTYAQHGHQAIEQAHDDVVRQRLSNLQALRDNYLSRADAAEKLGNLQLATETRLKAETFNKGIQGLIEVMRTKSRENVAGAQIGSREGIAARHEAAATGRTETTAASREKVAGMTAGGTSPEMADVFSNLTVKTDFGNFIDKSKVPAKLQPALLKHAADTKTAIVDQKAAAQLGEMDSAWRTLQDQAAQVMPYLSETNDPMKRAGVAARNMAMKAAGNNTLTAFDTQWGNSMRLLRATGPSTGFRFNRAEIDRSMRLDRPNTITDTQPILEQKMRNWRTLIENASRPSFSTDWRSIATPNGKVTVLAPDGNTQQVTPTEAEKLVVSKGYARIFGAGQLPQYAPPGQAEGNSQRNPQQDHPFAHTQPGAKPRALAAARKNDWDSLEAILKANPALDDDPDINKLIDNMRAK